MAPHINHQALMMLTTVITPPTLSVKADVPISRTPQDEKLTSLLQRGKDVMPTIAQFASVATKLTSTSVGFHNP